MIIGFWNSGKEKRFSAARTTKRRGKTKKENETQIWSTLVESGFLFSSNGNDIRRFITEGPFTPQMPKESPAQVGYWVGWQIVRSFMESHPNMTLQQLLELELDGNQFLQQSQYAPLN